MNTPTFWSWLVEQGDRVKAHLRANAREIADEVGEAFNESFAGLSWQIGPADEGPWEFCVSADGVRDRFPIVQRVVAEAPELPGWFVAAFRQRGGVDSAIEMGGERLDADAIWCDIRPAKGGVRLKLLIRGLTSKNEAVLSRGAVILLDNALGEYDAVMKVADLTRGPLPEVPEEEPGLIPFRHLPYALDLLTGR